MAKRVTVSDSTGSISDIFLAYADQAGSGQCVEEVRVPRTSTLLRGSILDINNNEIGKDNPEDAVKVVIEFPDDYRGYADLDNVSMVVARNNCTVNKYYLQFKEGFGINVDPEALDIACKELEKRTIKCETNVYQLPVTEPVEIGSIVAKTDSTLEPRLPQKIQFTLEAKEYDLTDVRFLDFRMSNVIEYSKPEKISGDSESATFEVSLTSTSVDSFITMIILLKQKDGTFKQFEVAPLKVEMNVYELVNKPLTLTPAKEYTLEYKITKNGEPYTDGVTITSRNISGRVFETFGTATLDEEVYKIETKTALSGGRDKPSVVLANGVVLDSTTISANQAPITIIPVSPIVVGSQVFNFTLEWNGQKITEPVEIISYSFTNVAVISQPMTVIDGNFSVGINVPVAGNITMNLRIKGLEELGNIELIVKPYQQNVAPESITYTLDLSVTPDSIDGQATFTGTLLGNNMPAKGRVVSIEVTEDI